MKHKIWFDDQIGILHVKVIGDFSKEETLETGQLFKELLKDKPLRQLIMDVSEAGSLENRETRLTANRVIEEAGITEVAYVGASSANRMIAKVLMKLGNLKTRSDFFKTNQEGLNWLKNRRNKK